MLTGVHETITVYSLPGTSHAGGGRCFPVRSPWADSHGLHDLARQGKEEMASVYLSFSCSHPVPSLSPSSPPNAHCDSWWLQRYMGSSYQGENALQGGVINVSCPTLSLGPLSFLQGRTGTHKKGSSGVKEIRRNG